MQLIVGWMFFCIIGVIVILFAERAEKDGVFGKPFPSSAGRMNRLSYLLIGLGTF